MAVKKNLTIIIPARSGSKRLVNKNIRVLGGRPLLEIAISNALRVVSPEHVFVSTDSPEYALLARSAGAMVPSLRPRELASDLTTDFEWLIDALTRWEIESPFVSILRTTSPLLTAASLTRAFEELESKKQFDSIRAVRRAEEHPGKMWRMSLNGQIVPLLPQILNETPSHSRPTQSLETVYVQCGAFEISRRPSIIDSNSISGHRILGFVLDEPESLDINTQEDFLRAESFLKSTDR